MEEEIDSDEDAMDLHILESEKEHEVVGPLLESIILDCTKPISTCKVNIDMDDKPKFVVIIDYWDDEIGRNIYD